MKKNRIVPQTRSRDKSETDNVSDTNSADGLTDAEKIVGVHILGTRDMKRHFGASRPAGQGNDKETVKKK